MIRSVSGFPVNLNSAFTALFTSVTLASVTLAAALPLTAMAQSTGTETLTAKVSDAASTKKDFPIRIKMVDTKITAKIVELDKANRQLTLQTAANDFMTMRVPKKVRNFDQVKVGDELMVHYTVAAAARINPAVKNAIRETVESSSVAKARPGAMPGLSAGSNVEVLANIQSFDTKARTVTIRGAIRTVTITVPEDFDMAKLQVGDQVQAEFTEAVVIDIERPAAAK